MIELHQGLQASTVWGPGSRDYEFVAKAEEPAMVQEPASKGCCWGVTQSKNTKPYACRRFARSVGTGAYCTCKGHSKLEAAARKLKAELGSSK